MKLDKFDPRLLSKRVNSERLCQYHSREPYCLHPHVHQPRAYGGRILGRDRPLYATSLESTERLMELLRISQLFEHTRGDHNRHRHQLRGLLSPRR